jgi:purine-nucleoside phosphorylase
METSALYFLGKSLGHNTLTLCAVLGNRLEDKQSNKPLETINKLIDIVLERL